MGVREPNDFDGAFTEMTRSQPDAILMVADALTVLNRKRLIEFATANQWPTIYEYSFLMRDRGLMSYGLKLGAIGVRVGDFVARVLLGARPADLPLEQPTRFELAINLGPRRHSASTFPAPAMMPSASTV